MVLLRKPGVGSFDVISISSSPPLIVARVFNDDGAARTTGFAEAAVSNEDVLRPSDVARIITPADPSNFRMKSYAAAPALLTNRRRPDVSP